MHRIRLALVAMIMLACAGLAIIWQRGDGTAKAATEEAAPTPGQLEILDKNGKTVGLCPLQHTDVAANVSGFVARVTVDQRFHNPSSEPIEAVYTFPLPGDSAVDDMTMTIGSRIVKGEIKRREEARQIYEAAKQAGQATALLDQERPNIFTQSVANIMPGEDVRISISYVNLLKYDSGKYEFTFPMVVGPRFVPGGGYTVPGQRGEPSPPQPAGVAGTAPATAVVTDADKITPPITPPGTRAGHDISIKVNLDAGVPLRDVTSQLHDVDVQRDGLSRAVVQLRDEKTIPNKDFILRYTVGGQQLETAVLSSAASGDDGYFTLIMQPPLAPVRTEIAPKEMIFVIDQTGSQSGWPIAKAKETMRYCIQNLNPGDTFQLIGFNTQVYPCFEKPVAASPETIAKALKFLEPIEGSGGTDILKSVDYALQLPTDPARPRIVCYMTDGYVGNDMQIIDYIQKHRGQARMFPFGVGNSVNRFLIDGMAREGRGVAEYVTLNQSGEEAAKAFYKRVADPLLLDVKVDWQDLKVDDVYPRQIPDVFSAAPIILKGRYTRRSSGDIIVSGLLGGRPWSKTIHVKFPPNATESDTAMETVWARERIEDLQAQDWMGAQTGHPNPAIKEQIVATALEYRLMSQWTSFVAVEKRVVNVGGKERLVDVPVEMPEGVSYSGIFGEPSSSTVGGGAFHYGAPAQTGAVTASGAAKPPRLTLNPNVLMRAGSVYIPNGAAGAAGAPGPVGPQGPPGPMGGALGSINGTFAHVDEASAVAKDYLDRDIALGNEAGKKRLDAMKPDERKATLIKVKLAAALQGLAERVKKEGANGSLHKAGAPEVDNGRVTIQIWLNSLPTDGLKQLQEMGFTLDATLIKDKLLLGSIAVDKLEALTELSFVRRVEPAELK
jgi:Ca-activated chloride channel family protein